VLENVRTPELMHLALDAAATGHLVIGGLAAASASGAIDRIIDLYPPELRRPVQLSLAHTLRGVVAQVLLKKKGGGRVAIDVQQGLGGTGDAYHMYPFFSGLCGYVFGKTKGGALNPKLVGLDNAAFMKNAPMIDRWNKEGLINAKIDNDTAKSLFTSGKAAFWVTGPWNIDTARKAGVKFKIVQMPKIKCQSAPFLGVGGVMVTKFARTHGVASAAKDFVGSYMASTAAQTTLSVKNGRYPANTQAAKKIRNTALRQIGLASAGGIPMPNIPQMDSVWADLGTAWLKSTKGAGATKARVAFKSAARSIRNKIAGG